MSNDDSFIYNVPSGCFSSLIGVLLAFLVCFLLSILLAGCKGKEYITETIEKPVIVTQEHHTENVRVDIVRDTIRQRDSVYYFVKGDTTIIERWHYIATANSAIKVDTLIKVDSVQVPVITEKVITKVQEVEKPLHWWQKFLIIFGGCTIIAIALRVVYKMRLNTKI